MPGAVDAFLKISLAVSLLGAAGSVGYYYSVYLPLRDAQLDRDRKLDAARSEDSRRAEKARLAAEKLEAEIKSAEEKREAEERQAAEREAIQSRYRSCISRAELNYNANWAQSCKRISDKAAKDYKECISGTLGKTACDSIYTERNASPTNCSLPRVVGQDINDELDKTRKRCLEESRAGLQ
jgi:hypothetical protein